MWLVVVGVAAVALKWFGVGFMADLSWWWVLAPFAAAALWWQFADGIGLTQRNAMAREDKRAADRREAQFESLGLRPPKRGGKAAKPPAEDKPLRSDR